MTSEFMNNRTMDRIELPEKVELIIRTLNDAGYEAFAVGGCVRDSLLGRLPEDWDITTSAKPEQVKALFRRTIDTGIQHGTVTIMFGKDGYEVTTYRIDGLYEDGRHPKDVTFTTNLVEDLKRRDFTINAMAFDRNGIVDEFDGLTDLKNGIIRAVGNPLDRFSEDALRILRALRFSAQLNYQIEADTGKAITVLRENLRQISAERIRVELQKLLLSAHPGKIEDVYTYGITQIVLPEYDAYTDEERTQTVATLNRCVDEGITDKSVRLACLLFSAGAGAGKSVLKRLKYDNETIRRVNLLLSYGTEQFAITPEGVRRQVVKIGQDMMEVVFDFQTAMGMPGDYTNDYRAEYQRILDAGECLSMKELALTGQDLIGLGMAPGKEMGETLQRLFDAVLSDPDLNTKEALTELALLK